MDLTRVRRILIYVAGPVRGKTQEIVDVNMKNAMAVAKRLWLKSIPAICPHANTHLRYGQKMPIDGDESEVPWIIGDLVMVERCNALLLCDNWPWSSGSCVERYHAAVAAGIPVYVRESDLITDIEAGVFGDEWLEAPVVPDWLLKRWRS